MLETIHNSLLGRHEQLSNRLRDRWAAQYPLVRSLADVWADQGWLVHDYSSYVLHLESALATVDSALKDWGVKGSDLDSRKLGRWIGHLEERAGAKGESGLAIALSKPFQRLLKYPLLFQVSSLYVSFTEKRSADEAWATEPALPVCPIVLNFAECDRLTLREQHGRFNSRIRDYKSYGDRD